MLCKVFQINGNDYCQVNRIIVLVVEAATAIAIESIMDTNKQKIGASLRQNRYTVKTTQI